MAHAYYVHVYMQRNADVSIVGQVADYMLHACNLPFSVGKVEKCSFFSGVRKAIFCWETSCEEKVFYAQFYTQLVSQQLSSALCCKLQKNFLVPQSSFVISPLYFLMTKFTN